jgi:hypothetical protein
VVDFQPALSSFAILASVVVTAKGSVAELAPLVAPYCPAALLRAETVLRVLGDKVLVTLGICTFDLACGACHFTASALSDIIIIPNKSRQVNT